MRVHDNFLIILWRSADVGIHFFPVFAAVIGFIESLTALLGLDDGINTVGIGRRQRQPYTPHIHRRQAVFQFAPTLAAIGTFVDGGARAAVYQRPHMTTALIGGGQHNIRVTGVHDHIGASGHLIHAQHFLPAFTAVGGMIQPAVAAVVPQRALGGHPNTVAVAGIDENFGDMLRLF